MAMNNPLNSVPVAGYHCECVECQAALLEFLWMYLETVEHRTASECFDAMRSQFRAMERAQRILTSYSRQLSDTNNQALTGEVDLREVRELTNRCGFCKRMLNQWNSAAAAKMMNQDYLSG